VFSVCSALQQLPGSHARQSHCFQLVMLAPGFPGGWKKPVQGLGGGERGSLAQAEPSASAAQKQAKWRRARLPRVNSRCVTQP
jgi:hypothetical protein